MHPGPGGAEKFHRGPFATTVTSSFYQANINKIKTKNLAVPAE